MARRVLLGVTGGIAAYKACELCRLLVQAGYEVTPVLTAEAEGFVTARTFEALARREQPGEFYPHLVDADLLVVAPLSANTLAKLAHGLADNVLTQLALAFRRPVLVAPAMNVRMWEHPATQANVETLRSWGVQVIGPEDGKLAEGETGPGRMSEPEAIFARARELLGETDMLAGKTVLVSAGGTREPLDSVRYVGNRSSGRMGVALAEEARRRGADVTLLAANLAVPPPGGIEVVETPTAADLAREATARARADVVLMAAAVADYAPEPVSGKRPKSDETWSIELRPTVDILAELGSRRNGRDRPDGSVPFLVGFGAEEGEAGLERKRRMLAEKHLDLVVFNDVARPDIGFDSAENEVVLVSAEGERSVPKASKERIAAEILDEVERLLGRR
jgi:phosphopantothenoylcysteine decarboxylase / phosphopantothenate---cysteine ligase